MFYLRSVSLLCDRDHSWKHAIFLNTSLSPLNFLFRRMKVLHLKLYATPGSISFPCFDTPGSASSRAVLERPHGFTTPGKPQALKKHAVNLSSSPQEWVCTQLPSLSAFAAITSARRRCWKNPTTVKTHRTSGKRFRGLRRPG